MNDFKHGKRARSRFALIYSSAFLVLGVLLANCGSNGNGDFLPVLMNFATENPDASSEMISAQSGGVVRHGDEVSLTVPAGSLAKDTRIKIEKIREVPRGASDGFSHFGQAFRLTPAGTKFATGRPAILRMKYDRRDAAARGLAEKSIHMYYFDERLGRYMNVSARLDVKAGEIVAYLEHFTPYLTAAKTALALSTQPMTLASQGVFPGTPRAGAPIYFRAASTAFDGQRAVARVQVCIQRAHTPDTACDASEADNSPNWNTMTKEFGPQGPDTYGFTLHEGNLRFLDIGDIDGTPATDMFYCFRAVDTLGEKLDTCGSPVAVNVTRLIDLAQPITWNPATVQMPAGSQRNFLGRARDTNGFLFDFIPGPVTINGAFGKRIGKDRGGYVLEATSVDGGTLEYTLQGVTAQASVSVLQGSLACMRILDNTSMPFMGAHDITDGYSLQLDVVGYDKIGPGGECGTAGNRMLVTPTWSIDPAIGTITQDGFLHVLDGSNSGAVTVTLAGISANQYFNIRPRSWNTTPIAFNDGHMAVTDLNGTIYIGAAFHQGVTRVYSWNGGSVTPVGNDLTSGNHNTVPFIELASDGSSIFAAYRNTLQGTLEVKRWNTTAWGQLGGALNVDSNKITERLSLALDNSTPARRPYVAFVERTPGVVAGFRIYVKRWNGSAWIQVGGALNQDVSDPLNTVEFPSISFVGNTPYVAFQENDAATGTVHVYVKRWDGSNWLLVGPGSLNVGVGAGLSAVQPSLRAVSATKLYVAWSEYDDPSGNARHIYVKEWDGSAWNLRGPSVNTATGTAHETPMLKLNQAGIPYVAWRTDFGGSAAVSHWNGTAWVQDGTGPVHADTSFSTTFGRPFLHFHTPDPFLVSHGNAVNGVLNISQLRN